MPDDLSAQIMTLAVTLKAHLELLMFLKLPVLVVVAQKMNAFMTTLEECE